MELYVSFRAISDTAFIELRLRLGEKGPPIFKEFFQAFGGFIPRNEEFFASSVYLQWGGKPSEHRIFARVPSFNEDFRRFGVYANYF
ncbi:hypothetical protein Mp_7g04080 [Marchantia polymorpha subsp. ruderalis]|uniref:Uncharacterized protein n=1 Tax=Marchantia polymorpha subsp. ruderalis TaxID=1480154 RepID=A0AAF6BVZ1_MARPO|nr:hypothetical protein Mp_7g04080 [Marchantia polymorpha subsp. ruderalis]